MRKLALLISLQIIALFAAAQWHIAESAPAALLQLDSATRAEDPSALYRMGLTLEKGFHPYIEKDSIRADSLIILAANKGYAPAQARAGYIFYNPMRRDRNVALALHYTEQAAMQGDAKAANNLGWMLMEGEGVIHDFKKAAYWFEKSADAGLPTALTQLGDLYRLGKGVEKDSVHAATLYDKAIAAGFTDAQNKILAMMMPTWQHLPDSIALIKARSYLKLGAPGVAVPLLEIAAQNNNPTALALLGDAYSRALGTEYNHTKALSYYFRAATAGNAPAQFVIGELLEVFPDALETLDYEATITNDMHIPAYWYNLAATKGITNAEEATRSLLEE